MPKTKPPAPGDPAPAADRPAAPSPFTALGLDPRLLAALEKLGYEEPTPIQRAAIPALLAGRDLLGQAATGTGKTAAFALPLLSRIFAGERPPGPKRIRGLILVPTRELAMQVTEAVHRYGQGLGARVVPIYGGQAIERQLRTLKDGVDVVVATPGRALDHIRRRTLALDGIEVLVLDEADEMLDMGFAEDLEAILAAVPTERQTALFAATMPPRIAAIATRHLRDPETIRIAHEPKKGELAKVRQTAYVVDRAHKVATLVRILDVEKPASTLVFCRTRVDVDQLVETLNARGFLADAIHGGLSQEQRDRVMRRFRAGTAELLVASDVAARGLDIEQISHVINYDVPADPDAYIHRIGRTGRAGRDGVAITLLEPRENRLLHNIEQATRRKIELAPIPSVADLRARQLERTRAAVLEACAGDNERFRAVVESLAAEFDAVQVAMAAIQLVHRQSGGDSEEEEIPTAPPRFAGPRPFAKTPTHGKPAFKPRWKVSKLFVGAGRQAGVRPADIVGAIVNETGLKPQSIGTIEIQERFSLVEIPDDVIDKIVPILEKTKLKGKKVVYRRDRS